MATTATLVETTEFRRWTEDHPNYCRECSGTGVGFEDHSVDYAEPCYHCQGYGKCPQCGWTTYDEHGNDFLDVCAMCGWEWRDWLTLPPPRYMWVISENEEPSVYLLNADLYEINAA